ncbi:hypothetical protein ACJ41P_10695 [Azospirillum argentinense]|uniref:Uncharacterized protein n=1 Tax=Azospirillum argentinense TaxID=2970906 RepID=A0ABW8VAV4_9PROT
MADLTPEQRAEAAYDDAATYMLVRSEWVSRVASAIRAAEEAAKRDAGYWKRCALWLASVHGANAENAASVKSVGKGEKRRQREIAAKAADMLRGHWPPDTRPIPTDEWVIDRLEKAKASLHPGATP